MDYFEDYVTQHDLEDLKLMLAEMVGWLLFVCLFVLLFICFDCMFLCLDAGFRCIRNCRLQKEEEGRVVEAREVDGSEVDGTAAPGSLSRDEVVNSTHDMPPQLMTCIW